MRSRRGLLAIVTLILWTGRAAGVVELQAGSATVDNAGDRADLCVGLETGGEMVAGTQNDLVWDGGCATLTSAGSCQIDPASGKQLHGGFPPQYDFTFRALVFSLSDVDPIPDGQLYCCSFQVEAAPGTCCSVRIERAGASDPKGNELAVVANNAQLCVASGGGTPLPTPTPIPGGDDDDGCQVEGAKATRDGAWLIVPALVVVALKRRQMR